VGWCATGVGHIFFVIFYFLFCLRFQEARVLRWGVDGCDFLVCSFFCLFLQKGGTLPLTALVLLGGEWL